MIVRRRTFTTGGRTRPIIAVDLQAIARGDGTAGFGPPSRAVHNTKTTSGAEKFLHDMAGERVGRHRPPETTVMSDRKYQQRGYQDDDRERTPRSPKPKAPARARRAASSTASTGRPTCRASTMSFGARAAERRCRWRSARSRGVQAVAPSCARAGSARFSMAAVALSACSRSPCGSPRRMPGTSGTASNLG